MLLLLALGCPPKTPPPGSSALERAPVERVDAAPGLLIERPDSPLPLGSALPFEEALTEPQRAFVEGEALVGELERLPEPVTVTGSRIQAQQAGDTAERAIAWFQQASVEQGLGAPSLARTGDAWRLAARSILELQAPDPTMQGFHEALRSSAQPLLEQSEAAYARVASDPTADARWRGHALWGLAEVERLLEEGR